MTGQPGILLTGANGYLGQAVARALRSAGCTVRGIGRPARAGAELDDYLACDLGLGNLPGSAFAGVDVVVHAAGVIPQPRRGQVATQDANLAMTAALLNAMRRHGARRLVHVSSAAVYGPAAEAIPESAPRLPVGEYGIGKLACEEAIAEAAREDGLSAFLLRKGSIFGGAMPADNNTARMIAAIARGRFFVPGDGRNRKSFLHVDDAAQVILAACGRIPSLPGGRVLPLNVADRPAAVGDVARAIAEGLGVRPPLRIPMPVLRLPLAIAGHVPPLRHLGSAVLKLASNDALDVAELGRTFPDLSLRDTVAAMQACAASLRA